MRTLWQRNTLPQSHSCFVFARETARWMLIWPSQTVRGVRGALPVNWCRKSKWVMDVTRARRSRNRDKECFRSECTGLPLLGNTLYIYTKRDTRKDSHSHHILRNHVREMDWFAYAVEVQFSKRGAASMMGHSRHDPRPEGPRFRLFPPAAAALPQAGNRGHR